MSLYKNFRNYKKSEVSQNSLSSRFDQPTYLGFKLAFAPRGDYWYNGAQLNINYDRMPHPLFAPKGTDDVNNRETYSSIDYLLDANEFTRARMLEEFISKFAQLESNNQWYFQKIDGLSELLKVDPEKGVRILSDKRLKITALEGLDLRMSHILNLYKKIAWDDTWQRWVLPDMMRYFTLKIYVTEYRTFHTPNQYDGYGNAAENYKADGELYLNILDDILPTWVITCEQCEFDIQSINFDYLNSLSINEDPTEVGLTFDIKVGNIYEEQIYPIFKNAYLIDKKLNGFDRLKDVEPGIQEDANSGSANFDSTVKTSNNNSTIYSGINSIAQGTFQEDRVHQTGMPFNESGGFNLPEYDLDDKDIDPTDPASWASNALSFGKSFATNFVNEKIDKAKITPIPGLGFSISEAAAALKSKNIITAFGLIRKSVDTVSRDQVGPSQLLGDQISDGIFRTFLEGVTQSKATSELQELMQEAANTVLNDNGLWEQIKDYSKATNLVGKNNEINILQSIQNPNEHKNAILQQTRNDRSLATDLDGTDNKINSSIILEGVPSSAATSNKIVKG